MINLLYRNKLDMSCPLQKFSPSEVAPVDTDVMEIDIELFGNAPYKLRLSIVACFKLGMMAII